MRLKVYEVNLSSYFNFMPITIGISLYFGIKVIGFEFKVSIENC